MTWKTGHTWNWNYYKAYETQKEFWVQGIKTGAWACQHPIADVWDDDNKELIEFVKGLKK